MDESRSELYRRIRHIVHDRLESLQRAGVQQLGRGELGRGELGRRELGPSEPRQSRPPASAPTRPVEPHRVTPSVTPSMFDLDPSATNLSPDERVARLGELCGEVSHCTRCTELVANRTQTVFGVGSPQARLCFFGEAPGADEDKQGEPFVGRAGQLLNKIIEACTLERSDVYILNVLKCRPPGNRNPNTDEVANCRPYFEQQLETIRPEFICCLGSIAAQTLLETTQSIGKLRGRLHRWRWTQVLATYHPAYLLRNPSAKRLVWEDMQLLMEAMGIELPKK